MIEHIQLIPVLTESQIWLLTFDSVKGNVSFHGSTYFSLAFLDFQRNTLVGQANLKRNYFHNRCNYDFSSFSCFNNLSRFLDILNLHYHYYLTWLHVLPDLLYMLLPGMVLFWFFKINFSNYCHYDSLWSKILLMLNTKSSMTFISGHSSLIWLHSFLCLQLLSYFSACLLVSWKQPHFGSTLVTLCMFYFLHILLTFCEASCFASSFMNQ